MAALRVRRVPRQPPAAARVERRPRMPTPRIASLAALLMSAFVTTTIVAGCSTNAATPTAPASFAPGSALATARREQEAASSNLLNLAGVVGTGASLDAAGGPEVEVYLAYPGVIGVPRTVGGVPVATTVTGVLKPWSLTGTYRPLPIGVSAGNVNQCVPGTIAGVLLQGNREFLLSANHVLARQNLAALGEAVSQPAPPDLDPNCASVPATSYVATLADFQPVVYDGKTANTMDAA